MQTPTAVTDSLAVGYQKRFGQSKGPESASEYPSQDRRKILNMEAQRD